MTVPSGAASPVPIPKRSNEPDDVFTRRPVLPRRDSRAARPPPIRIEMSSPAPSATNLPKLQLEQAEAEHEEREAQAEREREREAEEKKDNLAELPVTPSRHSFVGSPNGNGLGLGGLGGLGGSSLERPTTPTRDRPASPSSPWRSFETGEIYSPPRRPQSLHGPPPSWRNSLEVPSFHFATSPTSDRRFEPTPTHGLHARNLSAHFPQPGVPLRPTSPTLAPAPILIPEGDRKAFGGPSDWQFGQAPPPDAADELDTPETKRGKRRGHHHRHSLSHNFFSFLDPTQTNPSINTTTSPISPDTNPSLSPEMSVNTMLSPATPKPVPMQFNVPSAATLAPLPPGRDPQTQALGWFGVIESVLGVALWIEGQRSGWRCLTAIGYLVVFDAMGLAVNTLSNAQSGWHSVRKPYGSTRFTSLLCFSQSLFLLFAASYIAKESLEGALLGAGGHDHGGHGHGHGHSHGDVGSERPFPLLLLALASVASLFSGSALGNHRKLVDATGTLFLPPWYLASIDPDSFLGNPFTLSVAGTAACLAIAGLVVPAASLNGFDAGASLLLTLLTSALAWRPALAFGHILLQTAPPAASAQMKALRGALRHVADDRRVLGLGTFRCWAVDAGKPTTTTTTTTGPPPSATARSPSMHMPSPSVSAFMRAAATDLNHTLELFMKARNENVVTTAQIPLIVTLVIHVHPDSTDRDVMDITRASWTSLNSAINGKTAGGGEVSVQVQRGWDGVNR